MLPKRDTDQSENFDIILKVKGEVQDKFLRLPGVIGLGIGLKQKAGKRTNQLAIIIHVEKKLTFNELEPAQRIPEQIQSVLTDIVQHPKLSSFNNFADENFADEANEDIGQYRPIPGGCRIISSTATGRGSSGAYVVNNQTGKPCLLTNQHVVKDPGAIVFQPGRTKGEIGKVVVSDVQTDSALVEIIEADLIGNFILGIGPVQGTRVITSEDILLINSAVRKSGYQTGVTNGFVTIINYASNNPDGTVSSNDYYIEAYPSGNFCAPGDSGSVIVDDQYRVVGLLYAGYDGGEMGLAKPIDGVLAALNARIEVEHYPPLLVTHTGNEKSPGELPWQIYGSALGDFWFPDNVLPSQGADPFQINGTPALVHYRRQLYILREYPDSDPGPGYLSCAISLQDDSSRWQPDSVPHPSKNPSMRFAMSDRPGVVEYNGLLYCIRQGARWNGEVWLCTYDGTSWSDDVRLAPTSDPTNYYGTYGPPALCVFNNTLYCFRSGDPRTGDPATVWCFTYNHDSSGHGTYSPDVQLSPTNDPDNLYGAGSPPSAVTYRGKMYCARQSRSGPEIWIFSYDGNTWSADLMLGPTSRPDIKYGTTTGPSLIVRNDKLWLFHDGTHYDGYLWYATFDGTDWSEEVQLDLSMIGTLGQVSLAHIQNFNWYA